MTVVALEGMQFYAYHGYYNEEQIKGNNFVLDIYATLHKFDSEDDLIKNTVNYELIYELCKKHMQRKYRLLETVALIIARDIKLHSENIKTLRIKITKLNPPLDGDVEKAVIELSL